ncbi:hypothetical protein GDO81_026588, partial [Engystomops pustulosus]
VPVSGVTLRSNVSGPVVAGKEAVSLRCSSYGTDLRYSWMLDRFRLPDDPRYKLMDNNSTLVISPVMRSDGGAFSCRVYNYLSSEISNNISLSWLPDGDIQCGAERLGSSFRFYCSWPGGNPTTTLIWRYGSLVQNGFDSITADVPPYQVSLGRTMTCVGNHVQSSAMCSLVIDVPQSPGFINDTITTAKKGSSSFLSITLSSDTQETQILPAKFTWTHLDRSASPIPTSENLSVISDDFSSVLIIPHMKKEFGGKFMCKAENSLGSNYFTFILDVEEE